MTTFQIQYGQAKKRQHSHDNLYYWEDKEVFRKFAKFVKKTKTGDLYESDTVLFHRMLESYKTNNEASEKSNSTYPSKSS